MCVLKCFSQLTVGFFLWCFQISSLSFCFPFSFICNYLSLCPNSSPHHFPISLIKPLAALYYFLQLHHSPCNGSFLAFLVTAVTHTWRLELRTSAERENGMLVFLGLGYVIEYEFFQFHPFIGKLYVQENICFHCVKM